MLHFPDTLGFQDPRCPHATAPATASPAPSDMLIFPALDQWSTGALRRCFSQALALSLPHIWTPLDARATMTSPRAKFTTPPNLQHSPWRTIGIEAIKVCAQVKFLTNSCRQRGSMGHPPWPRSSDCICSNPSHGANSGLLARGSQWQSLTIALPILQKGKLRLREVR